MSDVRDDHDRNDRMRKDHGHAESGHALREGAERDRRGDRNDRQRANRSPEEIRRDIRETRARLSQDLDELTYRFSPAGLQRRAESALEGAQRSAVDATRGAASRLGLGTDRAGSSLLDRLGEHPLPTALLGAGIGWILMQASNRAVEEESAWVASDTRGSRHAAEDNALPIGVFVALAGLAFGAWWTRRSAEPSYSAARAYPAGLPSDFQAAAAAGMPPAGQPYDYTADLAHYEEHHGAHLGTGGPFSDYEPAYGFGSRLGNDPGLAGRSWAELEEEARRRWEREGTGTWEDRRHAVRYGFERTRTARGAHTKLVMEEDRSRT